MIEVIWKVFEAIIDTWIHTVVTFHRFLHGFCTNRGTETTIIELSMAQELTSIHQE